VDFLTLGTHEQLHEDLHRLRRQGYDGGGQ
jgi:hypothetical protein